MANVKVTVTLDMSLDVWEDNYEDEAMDAIREMVIRYADTMSDGPIERDDVIVEVIED